jgi:hypothetical protein
VVLLLQRFHKVGWEGLSMLQYQAKDKACEKDGTTKNGVEVVVQ